MTQYEYKCVAGPKIINIKNQFEINHAMGQFASIINDGAKNSWEFHSMETITIETPQGCFRKGTSINYHMLIFKRPITNQDS